MAKLIFQPFLLVILVVISALGNIVERDESKCSENNPPIQCSWNYLAYFPRKFVTGTMENIMVSIHGYPKPVDVNITLSEYKFLYPTKNSKIYTSVSQMVQPGGVLTKIPIYIPNGIPSFIKVSISGLGERYGNMSWAFQNSTQSTVQQEGGVSLFIQSDRPIYKPKQTIKFRVIAVDSNLRASGGKLDKVIILNPSGSRMRQWNDIDVSNGYASFELKTSEKPVLGNWKIEVFYKNYKKTLQIKLEKLVLPKFQVTVTPPSYITKDTETVEAEVCAKYSYGKSVFGKLSGKICYKRMRRYWYWYGHPEEKEICETTNKKIDGCTTISMDVRKNQEHLVKGRDYVFTFEADVKEKATGITLSSKKATKETIRNGIEISMETENTKGYKPGFPLEIKIFTKTPDGAPVLQVPLTVEVYAINFKKNITTTNGMYLLKLDPIPIKTRDLSVSVYELGDKVNRESLSLTPWYSPSHSYLEIEKLFNGDAKIGSFVDMKVHYTTVDPYPANRTIYYSTICAGNIVDSGSFVRTFIGTGFLSTTRQTTRSSGPFLHEKDFKGELQRFGPPTRPPLPAGGFKTSSFQFSFDITKEMMPFCRMNVYYLRQQEVVAANTQFEVEDIFENPVSMEFSEEEVRPGNSLKLKLKAAPNSKVAVTAVDQSVYFLADSNNLKQNDILAIRKAMDIEPTRRGRYNSNRCYGRRYRRRRSFPPYFHDNELFLDSEEAFNGVGASVMTSFRIDPRPCSIIPEVAYALGAGNDLSDGGPDKKKTADTRVRKDFPETWLWLDETVQSNGTKEIDVTVPDTITSWHASAFGISKSLGLGVAKSANVRVFQPFFVSLNLPYAVVRGEEVTVPAAVFSYLENACISVKVSLKYSQDYEMIAGPAAKACICGGRTATILFKIVPIKLGKIPIRITAQTLENNVCASGKVLDHSVSTADILVRKLLVEPEGVKNSYTLSSFMCTKDTPITFFKLRRPENLVPGSIYSKVSVMGDIMGSSLSNIDELLAMPYGCGEQNMLKFAPNIFIMNYLNSTNQATGSIKTKALDYMRSGYQRELTYKRLDDSYSAFGERDDAGSTWLSAFVLKSYAQARPWIEIDDMEIKKTAYWLMQLKKGNSSCILKSGTLHNKAMAGGVKSAATLNAYVVISLLESDDLHKWSKHSVQLQDIVYGCVAKELDDIKDSYSLAIMAYMFAKFEDEAMYKKIMMKLEAMAIKEDGMTHWEEEKEKGEAKPTSSWYYQARSTDIEQTAYVLLAMLEKDGKSAISKAVPIVRWLSKQRNDLGGWSSTQDTVLAMQSLAMFAELTYGASLNMKIDVTGSEDNFQHSFNIGSSNSLVLQQVEDIPVPGTLKVKADGDGCAIVQAIVRYNEKKAIPKASFIVEASVSPLKSGKLTNLKTCYSQEIKICPKWLGTKKGSNMAIIDVAMVSGFEANEKSLNKLIVWSSFPGIKDIETKGRNVYFYLNSIPAGINSCFSFIVDQTNVVDKMKEVPIKVYDYYDTEKSATIMYGIEKGSCKGVIKTKRFN